MAVVKSSIAKPSSSSSPPSPTAQKAVKIIALLLCLIVYSVIFWGLIFSAFRGGLAKGGEFISPSELIRVSQEGTVSERKRLWISLGLTLLVPIGFGLALMIKPRKLYGDARFGREAEVRKAGLRASWGTILGTYRNKPMVAPPPGNVLGCAPPGGGKGVGWVIPTLHQFQGSIVTLDPKKENWEKTAGFRAKYSKPGDCVLFDPLNYDGRGWRYNPLGQIGEGIRRIDEIDRIANMLSPNPLTGDTIWASGARDLFKGAVLAFAELNDNYRTVCDKIAAEGGDIDNIPCPEPVSIGSVYRLIVDGGICGERCAVLAAKVQGDMARRLLLSFAALPMKQAEGVLSALKDKIGIWGNPAIDSATAESDFTFNPLRQRRMSIYLGVTPDNIERLSPLLGLMFQQAIDTLVRRMPGPDEPYQVQLMIDEAALLKRLPVLASSIAFLRGYHGCIFLIYQSPAQGIEHYGVAGWRAIVETCKYRVFYAPNSLETATEISKELGTYTMKSFGKTRSEKGGSTSINSAKRDLLMPQEVLQMGRDKLILFIEGMRPVMGKKIRYYEDTGMLQRSVLVPPELPSYTIAHDSRKPKETLSQLAQKIHQVEGALVEQTAEEGVLEFAISEIQSAQQQGNADRVEELQVVAKNVAAKLPKTRPDDPAMIAALMAIGAR
jgi:type IV secretion system protein VirD4